MRAWRDLDSDRPRIGFEVRVTGASLRIWRRSYVVLWWAR
jgi:hypothetical protein